MSQITSPNHEHTNQNFALGHLQAAIESLSQIKQMIESSQPCAEVSQRLSGELIRITECRNIIIKDHIASCVQPALKPGSAHVLSDINRMLQQVLTVPTGSHH